jgi:lysophospholipase L1-like esterase
MLECLIMGDSIAKGISDVRKECVAYAKSGINSRDWLNQNVGKSPYIAKTVIISLGSNDLKDVKTEEELRTIRKLTKADRVYWIMPSIKESVMQAVSIVAQENGDVVLTGVKRGPDNVHPTYAGYKKIAEDTK